MFLASKQSWDSSELSVLDRIPLPDHDIDALNCALSDTAMRIVAEGLCVRYTFKSWRSRSRRLLAQKGGVHSVGYSRIVIFLSKEAQVYGAEVAMSIQCIYQVELSQPCFASLIERERMPSTYPQLGGLGDSAY